MQRAAHSRFKKDIRIKPDKPAPKASARACARPDCPKEGDHPVPKSRDDLNEHLWFCLEHARAHNESWDYFRGMSEGEIESFRDAAITGHRPTWPLGKRSARARDGASAYEYDDRYGVFGGTTEKPRPRAPERHLTGVQERALDVLNLDATATLHQIKVRYKELVKRFHPDANGGDRGYEERLKQVIRAYGVLRASGLT
ncbi:MAG: DnaJ domain-containing protein [Alphaproteobacteria bacterium]|nr:DnaJ domain-containing protein [Alphaproteobacteria bacterium]